MKDFKTKDFPSTRVATMDVCSVGIQKHHITALLEIDVSESREKIQQHKKNNRKISFTAWLIKVISVTIKEFEDVASYIGGKTKLTVFNNINVSVIVERVLNGQKVPLPLVIEKTQDLTIESITEQINNAKNQNLSDTDIVINHKSSRLEKLYYLFPGFLRRMFWKYVISHPQFAYKQMGNVSVTSVGMLGRANAWFVPISIHPICFGVGNILKKPLVVNNNIEIREVLKMTVLIDHDVVDGGLMARFISRFSENIEKGKEL